MGRRSPNQLFLPNKYVFPGGRVERGDRHVPAACELRPSETANLLLSVKGEPTASKVRGIAMAAVRETFEETGLLIGSGIAAAAASWSDLLAAGFLPRLSGLSYFARAITPPGRPRRYDTRFFYADASQISYRVAAPDGELSSLDWFNFDEMRGLDLPGITRVVIEDLAERIADEHQPAGIPFYFHRNGAYERVFLSQTHPSA